jgi:hypothetical protein
MARSSRTVGMMATICLTFSAVLPDAAHAGDDTELAKQLWAQGRVLSKDGTAMAVKMEGAFNQGDWTTACYYVRESQRNSQAQFDLTLRMSNLHLDPQNMATVQEQLANTRDALESINKLVNVPVFESTDDVDMKKLNVAVGTARKIDADGSASFANQRWSVACSYLTVAQLSYANNSRLAHELSERLSDDKDPRPQLARLSAELAGLEKAVTSKRDIACKNETLGG